MPSHIDPRALFGWRLRKLREWRGLTQEQLAQIAGLDRTYISSCENGRRNPTLITMNELATALEVRVGLLIDAPPRSADLRAADGPSNYTTGADKQPPGCEDDPPAANDPSPGSED